MYITKVPSQLIETIHKTRYTMINLHNVSKTYNAGKSNQFTALHSINLTIAQGEFVAITGKSGAGKSTLLHILGCIDTPTDGYYSLFNENIEKLNDRKLSDMRNQIFGFVMQDYALINNLSAYDNIIIPALLKKNSLKNIDTRIKNIAEKVDISPLLQKKVNLLSGGERQRVAIARSLINSPKILIADEPTGNLDSTTSEKIFSLFKMINQDNVTVIIVTHDNELAERFTRKITISDGHIINTT